jgi:hypothetical protein
VAIIVPSGVYATDFTFFWCSVRVTFNLPVATSHRRNVKSSPTLARRLVVRRKRELADRGGVDLPACGSARTSARSQRMIVVSTLRGGHQLAVVREDAGVKRRRCDSSAFSSFER